MKQNWVLVLLAALLAFHLACSKSSTPASPGPSNPSPSNVYSFLFSFGNSLGTHNGNGQFYHPEGIQVYNGEIFVVDAQNGRIQVFSPGGYYLRQFGNGTLSFPVGLSAVNNGLLYVSDIINQAVYTYDQNGNAAATMTSFGAGVTFNNPMGVGVDSQENLYVIEEHGFRLDKISLSNTANFVTVGGTGTGSTPNFSYPFGMALDGQGNVWVVDTDNRKIEKFDSNLNFLFQFGTPGTTPGTLNSPEGIAFDPQGNMVVSDTGNYFVEKFSPAGTFLTLIGTQGPGTNPGQFGGPGYMTFDPSGNLYVSDADNNHNDVDVFAPN